MIQYLVKEKSLILKYLILGLFLLNLPDFILAKVNPTLASILSIGSYILLIVYYLEIKEKIKPNMWMVFLIVFYFTIGTLSGQEYAPSLRFLATELFKLIVVIICGQELILRLTKREVFTFLIIGALSVVFHVFFFFDPLKDSGRFYGFYMNPNAAAFICMIGYALSFSFNGRQRLLGQIIFTLMGLLTLSRTFIIVWIILNLISIRIDYKNIRFFGYGFLLLIILVSFSEVLPFENIRLKQLSNFVEGKEVRTSVVNKDSRAETWSLYYDFIINKPLFGNGIKSFSGGIVQKKIGVSVGVHNTYLKILGEAGVFVFGIFITLYIKIIKESYLKFKNNPELFMMILVIALYLLTNHDYFETHYLILLSLWIQLRAFVPQKDYIESYSNLQ